MKKIRKVIVRKGQSAIVGRIARAVQQANADVSLRLVKESRDPVFWSCPLTGSKVYFK